MKVVTKIDKKKPLLPARKKVAAYARVSAASDRSTHSLSAQISYYSELIQRYSEWEYAGVYADNFISGTNIERRADFKRMLKDCDAGKIDIILTKSISRFARNTVDLLETIRHLRELGIEVRFEKENISSLSDAGELILTLLASFAQEESRSISENCKWGIRKLFQQGFPHARFRILGYEWENDHLVVVPEEAAVVKRIFQNFLDGKSRLETERELNAEGITTKNGKKWCDSNIKVILQNITYTGNFLLQKKIIVDPISKKKIKNTGQLPQYFVENTHEAIIDMATFQYVQDEMARRKKLGPHGNKALNTCCLTGKIKCPFCGYSYIHDTKLGFWGCYSKKMKKRGNGCPVGGTINHNSLTRACAEVLGLSTFDEDVFLDKIDHIEVHERHVLTIFFKDGKIVKKDCPNTGRRDCWSAEHVEQLHKRGLAGRSGVSCFTTKIRCATCNCSYHKQYRTIASGEKLPYWAGFGQQPCAHRYLRDDRLREMLTEVLGLESFKDEVFTAQIDHIAVHPDTKLTFHFKDGRIETRVWPRKRTYRKHKPNEKAEVQK